MTEEILTEEEVYITTIDQDGNIKKISVV